MAAEACGPTGVVGRSAALAAVLKQVALVAPLDVAVLLTGESGTGKTQLARVDPRQRPARRPPFVELNCAALPEELVESELFGALPGAHSTATRRMKARSPPPRAARLFLDEIGELPLAAQAKLLQLLQSKTTTRSARRARAADVRVIAATNADLERPSGREALPRGPLLSPAGPADPRPVAGRAPRRRRELATFFCERPATAMACRGHLSPAALRAVEASEWPGNVRQLDNAVEAAAIRAAGEGAQEIEPRHLFSDREAEPRGNLDGGVISFQEHTRRFQMKLLRDTLDETDWSIVDTARKLDLARSYVYKLIHAFGLQRSPK